MISALALLAPILAFWLWWPVKTLSVRVRCIAVTLTALLGASPMVMIRLMRSGAVDYATIAPLQVAGGVVLVSLMFLLLFMLARDASWLAARGIRRATWANRLHGTPLTGGVVVLAMAVASVAAYNGLVPPQVRETALALPGLPTSLNGLRVAVVADIHASPVNDVDYVQTIVTRTNAARPDLIVLPGDLVDGDLSVTGPHTVPLSQLSAPHGVWIAPGNHEYYSGYDAWMGHFRRLGLQVLANQTQILHVRGERLALSGIGDPAYGRTSQGNTDPNVPEGVPPDVAAVSAQARGADFHMLLAHQPKFARDNARYGVDLQISGHTHGGHMLGMDRWLVAPFNNGFVRGLYNVDDMRLFVSSGAGLWAGFTARLGIAPAIELLVLQRSSS
ncbi:metallophosphoesterase [Pigmentiphaga aceris]|uniref:Metallophosphoesterase n=1 Tax=Pigmentiphaga aceris TaxID=1940612 RepID=A0A5C0AW47_9BURK|nr:metallophosphoesterase [Pigmentiphaga aceris]QEI05100.1 metallophosphoesterase [Pigmentiphaga aceris]